MTSPTSVDLPAPADWQHFERLSRAIFSEVFAARFVRYGRAGQRQNGVDVLGRLPTGALIGVQCKGRSSSLGQKLTEKEVDAAIAEAETFPQHLDELFILTTAPEDAVLQRYVLYLSEARKAADKFAVTLWGWQSISDQIRSCTGVMQTFYGQWWRKPSLNFVAMAVALATGIGAAGFLGSSQIEKWFQARDASRDKTVTGLQQVGPTLDSLQAVYRDCVTSMAGKAFVFSADLHKRCIDPIDATLKQLERQRDEMAGLVSADAYMEVVAASRYALNDFRELEWAADMAEGLERHAVAFAKTACPDPKYRSTDSGDQSKSLRKLGEDALSIQMAQYFRMRDFAIPAIGSIRARLSVISRVELGQDVPRYLLDKANMIDNLLQEQRDFSYKPPSSPFALARAKQMSARTLTISGPANDPVDELVWSQTAEAAMFEGLRRNSGDVEFLIACGLLKPEARVLINSDRKNASPLD